MGRSRGPKRVSASASAAHQNRYATAKRRTTMVATSIDAAIRTYVADVKARRFPDPVLHGYL